MADEDRGAAHAIERGANRSGVIFDRVELVLSCNALMAVGLKQLDHFAETGSVGPQAVRKYDARFGGHRRSSLGVRCGELGVLRVNRLEELRRTPTPEKRLVWTRLQLPLGERALR